MFQASTACIVTDLTLVCLQHPRKAEAHVICSSLLLSWCFNFCNVFRRRCLAMSVRNRLSSWISWDFTHTRHCTRIHLHESPGAYSNILTCSPKKGLRTHRIEQETMFRQASSKSSFLPNVCGSIGPTKVRYSTFCWKNEKRKISESINMPRPQLLLPPLSLLLQLPSNEGFMVGAEPHEGCAKQMSKSSSFANLVSQPIQAQPTMTCEAPPSSWVYLCFTQVSPQEQPRHNSSAAACSSAGASASATASEAGSWQWSYLLQYQIQLVELVAIPPTHKSLYKNITIQLLNHAPSWKKNEDKTLPWTLNTSCSCLICDSIWLFSRICFSFP